MSNSASRTAQGGKWLRWFWILGVALLAFSLLGSRFLLGGSGSGADNSEPVGPLPVIAFGYGDVKGGILDLAPPFAGRVKYACESGDKVYQPGETLLELDAASANAQLQAAQADVDAAEVYVKIVQDLSKQHDSQVKQQEQAVEVAKAKLVEAQENSERAQNLFKAKQLSAEEKRAAAATVLAAQAAVGADEAKLTGVQAVNPQLGIARAEKDLLAKKALRDKAKVFVDDHVVKAPVRGTVLRVQVSKGDMYSPELKTVAINFCPAAERILRAEIAQEFAYRIQVGQRVCIREDSNSIGEWTGVVTHVGDWFAPRRELLPEPLPLHDQRNDQRTLECTIEKIAPKKDSAASETKTHPIRINERMRVTIMTDPNMLEECK